MQEISHNYGLILAEIVQLTQKVLDKPTPKQASILISPEMQTEILQTLNDLVDTLEKQLESKDPSRSNNSKSSNPINPSNQLRLSNPKISQKNQLSVKSNSSSSSQPTINGKRNDCEILPFSSQTVIETFLRHFLLFDTEGNTDQLRINPRLEMEKYPYLFQMAKILSERFGLSHQASLVQLIAYFATRNLFEQFSKDEKEGRDLFNTKYMHQLLVQTLEEMEIPQAQRFFYFGILKVSCSQDLAHWMSYSSFRTYLGLFKD